MENLPLPLKIAIVDSDPIGADVLKTILRTKPDIEEVSVFDQTGVAYGRFGHVDFSTLFIDIFSLGVDAGIEFIEYVRSEYPAVAICLYSPSVMLKLMPEVKDNWRNRFSHYYKLAKDQTIQNLDISSEEVLPLLAHYTQSAIARLQLSNLRTKLSQVSVQNLTVEQKQEIEEVASAAEKALQPQEAKAQPKAITIVPGINTAHVEQLVDETLREAKKSLQMTTNVNIGVLVAGSFLVAVSFIVASYTNQWEAVAFGGFGIAGIIASLITNPLKSIGLSSRRLVQIQVAYLAFLSQLSIINQVSENTTIIEQSKQLGDEMTRTLKSLEEYFGK